jgi:photosystem II stability/assembly factor-like uncharacterized protein
MRRSRTFTVILTLSVVLVGISLAGSPFLPSSSARKAPKTSDPKKRITNRSAPNNLLTLLEQEPQERKKKDRGLIGEKEEREKRIKEFKEERSDANGRARPDLWRKGIEHAQRMKIAAGKRLAKGRKKLANGQLSPLSAGGVVGVQWTQIGPAPLRIDQEQNFQGEGPDSGEVLDIAIDPRNATDNIIYIATNDGGVWKTTDGGTTWKPKTDFMPSLSMGAVELDPGNPSIVYAGTGNLFDGGGVFFKGVGIYKSLDGGETWSIIGGNALNGLGVNRIVLPAPGVLLVATSGGLFRSIDGGANFGNNAPGFNNNLPIRGGFITDLALDTADATRIYAAVNGSGIFVSTDSGVTFPAGSNLFTGTNGAPNTGIVFISFSQSTAPDNQTFYASVQSTTGTPDYAGLFKSTDGGATWTPQPSAAARAAENGGCQCGYDQTVGVDPVDANRVYIGFQELYLSTDGGANFGTPAVSRDRIHWDHHALVFSPASHRTMGDTTTRVFAGTDGGIHYSDNGGTNWANINEGIGTNIFFSMDIGRGSAANNEYTYGGCQDTGTVERRPEFSGNDWHLGVDGDGGQIAVDRANPLRAYGTDNGDYMITTDGGDNWDLSAGDSTLPAGVGFIAIDPNNSNNVYVTAGTQLFRSTDVGANFTSIKTFPATISSVAMVDIDSNTFWVGLTNGTVQHSANIQNGVTATWTSNVVTGSPGQQVRGIAIDPTNTDQVVIVYPGFSGINPVNRTKHVFRTVNNGTNWTDISGTDGGDPLSNLPDLPLHSVVIDPDTSPHTIIVSSDAGVMRSADLGASWQILGVGMPTVYSRSLQIDTTATPSLLRVGTYGRSVFELTAATGPLLAVNANLAFDNVCVGQNATRIMQLFNVGSEPLHISSIIRVSGSADFQIISGPATPVTILPGEEIDYTVRFKPTVAGPQVATFQINSDDPFQPAKQISASGTGTTPAISTVIADSGDFGNVCVGSFKDLDLTINNPGSCDLVITNIVSSSAEFKTAQTLTYPLVVQGGTSLHVPIRFQPTSLGNKNANITISSNAPGPDGTKVVMVAGHAEPGDIRVTGSTDFGDVCPGALAEKTVSVCNVGTCDLHVTSVSLGSCTDFQLINNPFPATVSHDSCMDVTIRFTPTSAGPKSCTLTINSDDPDQPVIMKTLTANTPIPSIDVSPDQGFPPEVIQTAGSCSTLQAFPISNKGSCNLTITDISIGGVNGGDFGLVGLPSFPIILQPGHTVGDGDLRTLFAPTALDRDRLGTVSVTYVSDPITGATTTITRNLCGEGVRTGARVLVTAGGVPVPFVEKIRLQRVVGNRNKPIIDTVDSSMNLPLQTVTPGGACGPFKYHKEYGTVSNPIQLVPGSYTVTATAVVNGKRKSLTVTFDVTTCDFNPTVVVAF